MQPRGQEQGEVYRNQVTCLKGEMTEMDDYDLDVDDLQRRMDGALAVLRQEFLSLRTGRASAGMVDRMIVNAYGSQMPMEQVGTINVPDPRTLSISVWDKSIVNAVVRTLQESGLGINPIVSGTLIRLPIPELNEERRIELSKLAAQHAESARVAIRNVRRDGNDQLRKAKAEGLSEDEVKLWEEEIQILTDDSIARVDEALESKKTEIMAV